jgi:protein-S-isoprenylcysteine O-methyltransferase Ste14
MFEILINSWIAIGVVIFIVLLVVTVPYGRHNRSGWGPKIPKRLGWILMETPALYMMWVYYFLFNGFENLVLIVFLFLWSIHYTHRSIIYPLLIESKGSMPFLVTLMAFFFNIINTFLHGYWFFLLDKTYEVSWLIGPYFLIGLTIFLIGMAINIHSDRILLKISKNGDGYRVPEGGLYKWISSPNYFGEIIEWFGWAIMTYSISGFVFFLWTFFNLFPRAISHHRWYKETFADYPSERKAIIPKII